ncbi:MAG: hypothetical protein HWE20_13580 [Gammaproteobacteria bacterium]|nr:hypothetical protein [Gammaproteobacteria bacterium]
MKLYDYVELTFVTEAGFVEFYNADQKFARFDWKSENDRFELTYPASDRVIYVNWWGGLERAN